jgi:hypothetical protein
MISETALAELRRSLTTDEDGPIPDGASRTYRLADIRAILSELDAARARAETLERESDGMAAAVKRIEDRAGSLERKWTTEALCAQNRATLAESKLAEAVKALQSIDARARKDLVFNVAVEIHYMAEEALASIRLGEREKSHL